MSEGSYSLGLPPAGEIPCGTAMSTKRKSGQLIAPGIPGSCGSTGADGGSLIHHTYGKTWHTRQPAGSGMISCR